MQRVMDKVLAEQKGRNVEVYLEEAVVESKSEQDLIEDVEETFYELQGVNMKLDPSDSTTAWVGNMLYYYRKSSVSINPRNEVPKENLQGLQGQGPKGYKSKKSPTKEGSGVGMILVDRMEREYSHAIHLNFQASEGDMDCEALLAGLVASFRRGMKDLHVFVDSRLLIDQVEGSKVSRTEEAKRYKEEIMDATTPFHRFWITHLLKALNPKTEELPGLASIQLEFLNQEVSVGVITMI
ncbi:reverse transcriptase domain-containing protein [Tanacetum coccineum]